MTPEQRKEWLAWRKIGGSDAPSIMGVSKFAPFTPYQWWEKKMSGKETFVNDAMKRGNEYEPEARALFCKKMGVELKPGRFEHPTFEFMTATLDGIDEGRKVAVEIKCSNPDTHEWVRKNKQVPEFYFPQTQHIVEVSKPDRMFYASYETLTKDLIIVEVEKDADYIQRMVAEEAKIWECLKTGEAPALTEKDFICREKDLDWEFIAKEIVEIDRVLKSKDMELKPLAKRKEELREALIMLAGDKNSLGAGVRLTKSLGKGTVDYSKVPELQGVDLSPYTSEPKPKWILTMVKS
jgi:putative phage-type endonuclease